MALNVNVCIRETVALERCLVRRFRLYMASCTNDGVPAFKGLKFQIQTTQDINIGNGGTVILEEVVVVVGFSVYIESQRPPTHKARINTST